MAAELGIGITVELLVALAKSCRDKCLAAKRYPEESTRIFLRLSYLLSKVPEWSIRIQQTSTDTAGCILIKNLYDSLTNLNLCVEAIGESNDGRWRKRIRLFLEGQNLLDKLSESESKLNQALLDLNHDNTSFVANQIAELQIKFDILKTIDEKISLM